MIQAHHKQKQQQQPALNDPGTPQTEAAATALNDPGTPQTEAEVTARPE